MRSFLCCETTRQAPLPVSKDTAQDQDACDETANQFFHLFSPSELTAEAGFI
jgi:hypothetical protein